MAADELRDGPRGHPRRVDQGHRRVAAGLAGTRGPASDLVVVPGGRNGALATGRIVRQAAALGATVLAAADRQSVTTAALAAEGLGVVTRRSVAAT